jgi:hypothetical protein
MPRLRRFNVSMFATPLSVSIAAGVCARTSEIRPPLHRNTKQNSRTMPGRARDCIDPSPETEWPILFQRGESSPNCSGCEYCHADTMQISLFCMTYFLIHNLGRYLLMFWRARRDSNS